MKNTKEIEKELKALEIIKKLKIIKVYMIGEHPNISTPGYSKFITQEQYDILNEILTK